MPLFDARYEFESIERGMQDDLANPVGQIALWYIYDAAHTEEDPIYDVGANSGGRAWYPPIPLQVIGAQRTEGGKQWQSGMYTADTLHITVSSNSAMRAAMPDLTRNWRAHLSDRVVFHGQVFTPTRIELRGIVEDNYVVVGIDMIQVNPEELVNDSTFQRYAAL